MFASRAGGEGWGVVSVGSGGEVSSGLHDNLQLLDVGLVIQCRRL
jgi:hypothetical protein